MGHSDYSEWPISPYPPTLSFHGYISFEQHFLAVNKLHNGVINEHCGVHVLAPETAIPAQCRVVWLEILPYKDLFSPAREDFESTHLFYTTHIRINGKAVVFSISIRGENVRDIHIHLTIHTKQQLCIIAATFLGDDQNAVILTLERCFNQRT